MFRNYLRIAFQQLTRQPVYSAIKILSLTLGLAASVLVIMHVQYIQSFNKHVSNWENTYRLVTHMKVRETNEAYRTMATAEPYIPQLRLNYPEQLQSAAKIRGANSLFRRNNNDSAAQLFYWAEPDAIDIFDLQFLQGDPETALNEPNTAILSESVARKYFGDDEAFGQMLSMDGLVDLRVTGIIADPPDNTTHEMPMLVSVPTGAGIYGQNFMNSQGWTSFLGSEAFVSFPDRETARQVGDDLQRFIERNLPENAVRFADQIGLGLSLQPITDIYLNPLDNFGAVENSPRKTTLIGLLVFSVLILATSCINYINLSLAQITRRSKEIGIRKTLGANRGQIVQQFLTESLLYTLLAMLIALPLVALILPIYTNLTDTAFGFTAIFRTPFVAALAGLTVLTGLIAGLVPALSVARLQPTAILKTSLTQTRLGKWSKAIVTAAQFTLSTALILLALAILMQSEYLRNRDVGYDKDNLVILDSRFDFEQADSFNYQALMNDLQSHPGILSIASADGRPPGTGPISPWRLPSFAPDESITVAHIPVSPGYVETFGMELLAGRTFSEEFTSDFIPHDGTSPDVDQSYGVVVTDQLLRRFGYTVPEEGLGEILLLGPYSYRVIGVIRAFQFSSGMEQPQRSLSLFYSTLGPMRYVFLRLDPDSTESALNHIDAVWERHRPGTPLDRRFFSEDFESVIDRRTEGLSMAALISSIITTIIAGFGLFALASYSTERRTKEVGIRKTLGAESGNIVRLLTWDFIKPVLIACVTAWPLAYLAIDRFYKEFSDSADFPFMAYMLVTIGIVGLALLTVVVQCFRTANSDPVKSLRYE